jgi:PKD repeat protein
MKISSFFILASIFFLTTHIYSQDTLVLQPGPDGKDAQINTLHAENNYGTSVVFKSMAWTHSGVPASHRALIGFNLSFLSPESTILQASLDLYFKSVEPNGLEHSGENACYLMKITEPWEEDQVTWNNQPETSMEDVVVLPQSTYPDQDYTGIDVTALVQAMVSDPEHNHGLLFRLITEEYYRNMTFASGDCDEPAKWPRLEIIYIGCTVPQVDFGYQAAGQSVSFTGISQTATSWHWDFGDGDTANIQNPEHFYIQDGFYQVCLTVEDSCYHAEYCQEIEICTAPPVAGFSYTTDGLTVFFQDESDAASAFYWDFGDGYFSSVEDPFHIYDVDGEYNVCLIAGNSCGSDTVCQLVDICAPPASGFDYSIDGSSVYFENQSVGALQYFWDFGDGYYSNLADPWHEYEDIGNYEVCLTSWNECGADTLCNLLHLSTVSIPENGDGTATVYPNPARDKVFVRTSLEGKAEIGLFDLSGKEIIKQDIFLVKDEPAEIDLGNIDPGIYILRMDSGTNQSINKLVIMK